MINITQKELEKVFRKHDRFLKSQENTTLPAYKLILFYTVECGLKCIWMRNNNIKKTNRENDDSIAASQFKHDLNRLINELKLNKRIPKGYTKNKEKIEPHLLHQAWRYGKILVEEEEKKCIEALECVLTQLRNMRH